jgi:hypothetical protein
MRSFRVPIAGLMGVVLVVALGMAALRNASEALAGVTYLMTAGILCLAVVGVVCRGASERAWWLGFALFGWGYSSLVFRYWNLSPALPTTRLLLALEPRFGFLAQRLNAFDGESVHAAYFQVGQSLWTIVAAFFGGLLARVCFGGVTGQSGQVHSDPQLVATMLRRPWIWPAIIALTGFALVVSVARLGSRISPELGSGAAFVLTCGLIGLAGLGAVLGRGKRREIWLGASLFGAGFLLVALGPFRHFDYGDCRQPVRWLDAFRLVVRPFVSGALAALDRDASANARIWTALEQPVPMRFPEISLEDLLKYVQDATVGPDGKRIALYVDPIGLQEAEKSMSSMLEIDLVGVPLGTSLRLCLDQIGLQYAVKDGFLFITSAVSVLPPDLNPLDEVMLCLLALLAAVVGGAIAPLVSDLRRVAAT